MAQFCTKCGAPLSPGTGFCSSCGAPVAPVVGAFQTTPVPAPPYGAAPPPAGYPVGAYPARGSGGALKVVLIVLAVAVALGVVGLATIGFIAHKALHVNANANGVTVSIPGGGTVSAGDTANADADLGVEVYPGAVREKGGVQLNSSKASMVMEHFSTRDSQEQVVNFYKGKLGDSASVVTSGSGTVVNSNDGDRNKIVVTVAPGDGDEAGKTTILILHSKKGV